MPASDYCDFCDLPKGTCPHRDGSKGPLSDTMFQANEAIDEASLGPWITAQYHGHCAACRKPIRAGQQIRSDGVKGWLCERCG